MICICIVYFIQWVREWLRGHNPQKADLHLLMDMCVQYERTPKKICSEKEIISL